MTTHLPPRLQSLLKVTVGMPWPEGDEGDLWKLANEWQSVAEELDSISADLLTEAANLSEAITGATGDALYRLLSHDLREGAGQLKEQAEVYVKMLKNAASDIQKTKIMIIVMLAALAASIAGLAISLFGSAAIPGVVASARLGIGLALRGLLSRLANYGFMNIARQLVVRTVAGAAFGAGFMVALDSAIQGVQLAQGHRSGFDTQSLKAGAISGAIGGAAGGLASGLLGVGRAVGRDLWRLLPRGVQVLHPLSESIAQMIAAAASNPAINLATHSSGGAFDGVLGALDAGSGGGRHHATRIPSVDPAHLRPVSDLHLTDHLPRVSPTGGQGAPVPVTSDGRTVGTHFQETHRSGGPGGAADGGRVPVQGQAPATAQGRARSSAPPAPSTAAEHPRETAAGAGERGAATTNSGRSGTGSSTTPVTTAAGPGGGRSDAAAGDRSAGSSGARESAAVPGVQERPATATVSGTGRSGAVVGQGSGGSSATGRSPAMSGTGESSSGSGGRTAGTQELPATESAPGGGRSGTVVGERSGGSSAAGRSPAAPGAGESSAAPAGGRSSGSVPGEASATAAGPGVGERPVEPGAPASGEHGVTPVSPGNSGAGGRPAEAAAPEVGGRQASPVTGESSPVPGESAPASGGQPGAREPSVQVPGEHAVTTTAPASASTVDAPTGRVRVAPEASPAVGGPVPVEPGSGSPVAAGRGGAAEAVPSAGGGAKAEQPFVVSEGSRAGEQPVSTGTTTPPTRVDEARPAAENPVAQRPVTQSGGSGESSPGRPVAQSGGSGESQPGKPVTESAGSGAPSPSRPVAQSAGSGEPQSTGPATRPDSAGGSGASSPERSHAEPPVTATESSGSEPRPDAATSRGEDVTPAESPVPAEGHHPAPSEQVSTPASEPGAHEITPAAEPHSPLAEEHRAPDPVDLVARARAERPKVDGGIAGGPVREAILGLLGLGDQSAHRVSRAIVESQFSDDNLKAQFPRAADGGVIVDLGPRSHQAPQVKVEVVGVGTGRAPEHKAVDFAATATRQPLASKTSSERVPVSTESRSVRVPTPFVTVALKVAGLFNVPSSTIAAASTRGGEISVTHTDPSAERSLHDVTYQITVRKPGSWWGAGHTATDAVSVEVPLAWPRHDLPAATVDPTARALRPEEIAHAEITGQHRIYEQVERALTGQQATGFPVGHPGAREFRDWLDTLPQRAPELLNGEPLHGTFKFPGHREPLPVTVAVADKRVVRPAETVEGKIERTRDLTFETTAGQSVTRRWGGGVTVLGGDVTGVVGGTAGPSVQHTSGTKVENRVTEKGGEKRSTTYTGPIESQRLRFSYVVQVGSGSTAHLVKVEADATVWAKPHPAALASTSEPATTGHGGGPELPATVDPVRALDRLDAEHRLPAEAVTAIVGPLLHRLWAEGTLPSDRLGRLEQRLRQLVHDQSRELVRGGDGIRLPLSAWVPGAPDVFVRGRAHADEARYTGVLTGETAKAVTSSAHEDTVEITKTRSTSGNVAGSAYGPIGPTAAGGTLSLSHERSSRAVDSTTSAVGVERAAGGEQPLHRLRYPVDIDVRVGGRWTEPGETLHSFRGEVEVVVPEHGTAHAEGAAPVAGDTPPPWHDIDPGDDGPPPADGQRTAHLPAGFQLDTLKPVPDLVGTVARMVDTPPGTRFTGWLRRAALGSRPANLDEHRSAGVRAPGPDSPDERTAARDALEHFASLPARVGRFERTAVFEDTVRLRTHNRPGLLGDRERIARVTLSAHLANPRILAVAETHRFASTDIVETTRSAERTTGSRTGVALSVFDAPPGKAPVTPVVSASVDLGRKHEHTGEQGETAKETVTRSHTERGYLVALDATYDLRTTTRHDWHDLVQHRHEGRERAGAKRVHVPEAATVWVPASQIHHIGELPAEDLAKLRPEESAAYQRAVADTGQEPVSAAEAVRREKPEPPAGEGEPDPVAAPATVGRGSGWVELHRQAAGKELLTQIAARLKEWSQQHHDRPVLDLAREVLGLPVPERRSVRFGPLDERLVHEVLGPRLTGAEFTPALREMLNGGHPVFHESLTAFGKVEQAVVLRAELGPGAYRRTVPGQTVESKLSVGQRSGTAEKSGWSVDWSASGAVGAGVKGRPSGSLGVGPTGSWSTSTTHKTTTARDGGVPSSSSTADSAEFVHDLHVTMDVHTYARSGYYRGLLPGARWFEKPWSAEFSLPAAVRSTVPLQDTVPLTGRHEPPLAEVTGSWREQRASDAVLGEDTPLHVRPFDAPGLHRALDALARDEGPRPLLHPRAIHELHAATGSLPLRAHLRELLSGDGYTVTLPRTGLKHVTISADLVHRELVRVLDSPPPASTVEKAGVTISGAASTEAGPQVRLGFSATHVQDATQRPGTTLFDSYPKVFERKSQGELQVSTSKTTTADEQAPDGPARRRYLVRLTPRWEVTPVYRSSKAPRAWLEPTRTEADEPILVETDHSGLAHFGLSDPAEAPPRPDPVPAGGDRPEQPVGAENEAPARGGATLADLLGRPDPAPAGHEGTSGAARETGSEGRPAEADRQDASQGEADHQQADQQHASQQQANRPVTEQGAEQQPGRPQSGLDTIDEGDESVLSPADREAAPHRPRPTDPQPLAWSDTRPFGTDATGALRWFGPGEVRFAPLVRNGAEIGLTFLTGQEQAGALRWGRQPEQAKAVTHAHPEDSSGFPSRRGAAATPAPWRGDARYLAVRGREHSFELALGDGSRVRVDGATFGRVVTALDAFRRVTEPSESGALVLLSGRTAAVDTAGGAARDFQRALADAGFHQLVVAPTTEVRLRAPRLGGGGETVLDRGGRWRAFPEAEVVHGLTLPAATGARVEFHTSQVRSTPLRRPDGTALGIAFTVGRDLNDDLRMTRAEPSGAFRRYPEGVHEGDIDQATRDGRVSWTAAPWPERSAYLALHGDRDTFTLDLTDGRSVAVRGDTFARVLHDLRPFREMMAGTEPAALTLISCDTGALVGPGGAAGGFQRALASLGYRQPVVAPTRQVGVWADPGRPWEPWIADNGDWRQFTSGPARVLGELAGSAPPRWTSFDPAAVRSAPLLRDGRAVGMSFRQEDGAGAPRPERTFSVDAEPTGDGRARLHLDDGRSVVVDGRGLAAVLNGSQAFHQALGAERPGSLTLAAATPGHRGEFRRALAEEFGVDLPVHEPRAEPARPTLAGLFELADREPVAESLTHGDGASSPAHPDDGHTAPTRPQPWPDNTFWRLHDVRPVRSDVWLRGTDPHGAPVLFRSSQAVVQPIEHRGRVVGATFLTGHQRQYDLEWGRRDKVDHTLVKRAPDDPRGPGAPEAIPNPWPQNSFHLATHGTPGQSVLVNLAGGGRAMVDGATLGRLLNDVTFFHTAMRHNRPDAVTMIICYAGAVQGRGGIAHDFQATLAREFGYPHPVHAATHEVDTMLFADGTSGTAVHAGGAWRRFSTTPVDPAVLPEPDAGAGEPVRLPDDRPDTGSDIDASLAEMGNRTRSHTGWAESLTHTGEPGPADTPGPSRATPERSVSLSEFLTGRTSPRPEPSAGDSPAPRAPARHDHEAGPSTEPEPPHKRARHDHEAGPSTEPESPHERDRHGEASGELVGPPSTEDSWRGVHNTAFEDLAPGPVRAPGKDDYLAHLATSVRDDAPISFVVSAILGHGSLHELPAVLDGMLAGSADLDGKVAFVFGVNAKAGQEAQLQQALAQADPVVRSRTEPVALVPLVWGGKSFPYGDMRNRTIDSVAGRWAVAAMIARGTHPYLTIQDFDAGSRAVPSGEHVFTHLASLLRVGDAEEHIEPSRPLMISGGYRVSDLRELVDATTTRIDKALAKTTTALDELTKRGPSKEADALEKERDALVKARKKVRQPGFAEEFTRLVDEDMRTRQRQVGAHPLLPYTPEPNLFLDGVAIMANPTVRFGHGAAEYTNLGRTINELYAEELTRVHGAELGRPSADPDHHDSVIQQAGVDARNNRHPLRGEAFTTDFVDGAIETDLSRLAMGWVKDGKLPQSHLDLTTVVNRFFGGDNPQADRAAKRDASLAEYRRTFTKKQHAEREPQRPNAPWQPSEGDTRHLGGQLHNTLNRAISTPLSGEFGDLTAGVPAADKLAAAHHLATSDVTTATMRALGSLRNDVLPTAPPPAEGSLYHAVDPAGAARLRAEVLGTATSAPPKVAGAIGAFVQNHPIVHHGHLVNALVQHHLRSTDADPAEHTRAGHAHDLAAGLIATHLKNTLVIHHPDGSTSTYEPFTGKRGRSPVHLIHHVDPEGRHTYERGAR